MANSPLPVCVAFLVVLSGCGSVSNAVETRGPATQPVGTPASAPVAIAVEGDARSIDVNWTFERVRQLTGTDIEPPSRVTFEAGANPSQFRFSYESHPFLELLGAGSSNLNSTVAGRADGESVRVSYTDDATAEQIEHVLAHEFAHVVQHQAGLRDTAMVHFEDDYSQTTDGRMARESVTEGAAEYVATEYDREYLPESRPNETVPWDRESESLSSALYWEPYRYGARYVAQRIDSPRQLEIVHQSPPRTTEQVLHGYVSDEEPRKPLSVRSNSTDSDWGLTVRDTVGELTIRLVLATELADSAAVHGGTGWGNDEVLTYHNGSSAGFVWVTRWDDSDNASTFERTFERYLSQRATERDGSWHNDDDSFRVVRSHDDTVVIFGGPESFVRNASIDSDGREVVVVPPSH